MPYIPNIFPPAALFLEILAFQRRIDSVGSAYLCPHLIPPLTTLAALTKNTVVWRLSPVKRGGEQTMHQFPTLLKTKPLMSSSMGVHTITHYQHS